MAPAHLQRTIRPALEPCTRHSLTSSRLTASRHRMLSARSPYDLGQATRYMCWWGKKRNGWFYTTFDHRFRKYLRRRGIDPRSFELDAGARQQGAESHRSFSRSNDDSAKDSPAGGQDPFDPFTRQREMMRQRMEAWKTLLERDPYEALFGRSNAMLKGRGWHPFWSEFVKGKEQSEVQDQPSSNPKPSAIRTDSPQSHFIYDPISGRMIIRDATENVQATTKNVSEDGAVDIPVKPFKGSSGPEPAKPDESDPLDSLHSALSDYEAKHGLKSPKVSAQTHTDSVREALEDYESRTRKEMHKTFSPEAERLRECLREYETQADKTTPTDNIPNVEASSAPTHEPSRTSAFTPTESDSDTAHPPSRKVWYSQEGHEASPGDKPYTLFDRNSLFGYLSGEQAKSTPEKVHPVKSRLPEDDIDILQASDVRANMGILRHPQRQTSKEKEEERARLERDFDSAVANNESESVSKPSIPKKPAAHTDKSSPPVKRWISTEIEEQRPSHSTWKNQALTSTPEPQPQKLQTSVQFRELQPIQTSLDRLRYSYREIKRDLAAQQEHQKIENERDVDPATLTEMITKKEETASAVKTDGEEHPKEQHEMSSNESQQAAPTDKSEERIDDELHSLLKDYEQQEPSSVYRYSSLDDLDFETPSHQGSTSSATKEPTSEQTSDPETDVLPSLESLLSSDSESILVSYGDKPKRLKIATHSDIGSGLSSEPTAQALSKFVRPDLFFPYLSLLDKYDIVKSSETLLVLRSRAPITSGTSLEDTQELSAASLKPKETEVLYKETFTRLPINPIDGTTIPLPEPPIGNFASPTGFVSYSPPPTSAAPSSQESGEEETSDEDRQSERPKSRGGGVASVARTAIWAGAACYVAGVVGELMK